jgi:hypothetical protein
LAPSAVGTVIVNVPPPTAGVNWTGGQGLRPVGKGPVGGITQVEMVPESIALSTWPPGACVRAVTH